MKILVLSTGGTIGSYENNGIISPDERSTALLVLLYESTYQDVTAFDCVRVSDTLSESITDEFYEKLINQILSSDGGMYDGIIVLHGTDTLAYTASLTAMVCRNVSVPVGFVSANKPIKNPKSNALINFRAAVEYMKSGGKGFFVPYKNSDGKINIHLATRILEPDFLNDDFYSIENNILAEYKNDKIIFYENDKLPTQAELSVSLDSITDGVFSLSQKVMLVKSYPGIDYNDINIKRDVSAVLNTAYHSGTAPCAQGSFGLPEFSSECRKKNIDVYLAGLRKTENIYSTADEIFKSGVEPLYSMTVPAALSKLRAAYNSKYEDINPLILNDLYYETI